MPARFSQNNKYIHNFIGIVAATDSNYATFAILKDQERRLEVRSFVLPKISEDEVLYLRGEKEYHDFISECDNVEDFLISTCGAGDTCRVLLGVPSIAPDPGFPKYSEPPCSILEHNSIFLKCLPLLARLEIVAFISTVLDANEPNSRIAIRPFIPDPEYECFLRRQPMFLGQSALEACAELFMGAELSSRKVAGMAALMAKWSSAYTYWSSFGRVQSSQDVVSFMRLPQSRSCVGSASENYWIRKRAGKKYEDVSSVPLEYALSMQKYKHLAGHDSLKVALVHVCKCFELILTCHSTRALAEKGEYTQVWPMPEEYTWILDWAKGPS